MSRRSSAPTVLSTRSTTRPSLPLATKPAQTVSIMSSAPSVQNVVAGQSITFTAGVTNTSGSGFIPTGTITFEDGSTVLATVTLDGTGNASYTTSSLPTNPSFPWATHFISAVYSGDSHFTSGTAMLNQTVHESATTTTLTSSPDPASFGQAVTFTATVEPTISGLGGFTGVVTFEEGTSILGQTPISSSGVATFTTSALAVGSHTITAAYYSDPVYAASSGDDSSSPQLVQSATTTTVSSSPEPSVFGQTVTVTALITDGGSGAGIPTGTVSFTEGGDTLASAVPVDSTGHASFTLSSLAVGSHTITATFSGTAGWGGSSGNNSASPQIVNPDATTTSVVLFGQSLGIWPERDIHRHGDRQCPRSWLTHRARSRSQDGTTTLGTGTLSGGTATFSTSSLAVGSHSITASYGGDTNDAGSSSGAVSQTVNPDATTTSVSSSANPSVFGQSVTFTATVTVNAPGAGSPTGHGHVPRTVRRRWARARSAAAPRPSRLPASRWAATPSPPATAATPMMPAVAPVPSARPSTRTPRPRALPLRPIPRYSARA